MNGTDASSQGSLRIGDAALTLWVLGGLAAGVPIVALRDVSWGSAALLDAGLIVGAVLLALAIAAGLRHKGLRTVFLEPSIRQGLLVAGLAAIVLQAAIIQFRPFSIAREKERIADLARTFERTSDEQGKEKIGTPLAVQEAAIRQSQSSHGPEKEIAEEILKKFHKGDDPLPVANPPAEEPRPAPPEPQAQTSDSQGQSTPPARSGQPSPTPPPPPESPPKTASSLQTDVVSALIRMLAGPLGALLRSLFGLNGGEEYRELATQAVMTLDSGGVPSPELLKRLMETLSPDQQEKALKILGDIARRNNVDPSRWRDHATAALIASSVLSDDVRRLLADLKQGKPCQEVAKGFLVDGIFVKGQPLKDEIRQALITIGQEKCWREAFEPVPTREEGRP